MPAAPEPTDGSFNRSVSCAVPAAGTSAGESTENRAPSKPQPRMAVGKFNSEPVDKHAQMIARAEQEGPSLRPRLQVLKRLYLDGCLSPPDACVAYIITYLQVRFGAGRWLVGVRKAPPDVSAAGVTMEDGEHTSMLIDDERFRDAFPALVDKDWAKLGLNPATATLRDLVDVARFRQLADHVSVCLANFYRGRRPLELRWRIPTPAELLQMQARGRRVVSCLISEKALQSVFGHRDCLEMLVHDLSHMEKFVEHGAYWQQVGFFTFLEEVALRAHSERWAALYGNRWRLSWRYVSSDMNAVATHLLNTLKSQLQVAAARATLRNAGLVSAADAEVDAMLANQHADVYPRAALSEWEPALAEAGLLDTFQDNFKAEWSELLDAHVDHVAACLPGVFSESAAFSAEAVAEGDKRFERWPRPTAEEFSTSCLMAGGTGFSAKYAAAIIAHFDELGRRHLSTLQSPPLAHDCSGTWDYLPPPAHDSTGTWDSSHAKEDSRAVVKTGIVGALCAKTLPAAVAGSTEDERRRSSKGAATGALGGVRRSSKAAAAGALGGVPSRKFDSDLEDPPKTCIARFACVRAIARGVHWVCAPRQLGDDDRSP
eukprot:TRINITY_DN53895_c0_g1_i1.p1 TRINITY_DN53895_c0_g1~~TRINITY_DN53895_c0_g1_i1.p1  ORF type:complete len:601 (+),score=86.93 TRINITY_DN53895_c0_g1_i1:89-1891(+)